MRIGFRSGFALIFLSLALVSIALLPMGCGLSDKHQVEEVATTFFDAAAQGDKEAVERNVTQKACANIGSLEAFLSEAGDKDESNAKENEEKSDNGKIRYYELGEPVIEDGEARVPVRFKGKDGERPGHVRMKREDGEWRVFAIAAEMVPGQSEIEFNLESPDGLFVEMMRGFGKGVGQTLKVTEQGLKGFVEGLDQGMKEKNGADIHEVPSPQEK